eukprot:gene293-919_t
MDLKLIVTNFGDDELYTPLSKEIERRLPSRSVEWKRSFGRSAKTVCLKASFTRYNIETLAGTSEGSVNKKPFLHIYWTSCMENDDFRNKTKQKIQNWQQNLKSRDIHEWLVIQVVTQDLSKQNRTKITLPRSSVFDKIKNDICGKNQLRCAQLWEPDKETLSTKSAESWDALVSQLRDLLLESISEHLTKFEEKEELAIIYKSVTLHEDALIQYDELDALFSQFVVNGKIKGRPTWLDQFAMKFDCWDGISLHKQAIRYYHDIVYNGTATLIELRNYLFMRQWQMLTKIIKDAEVIHRLLEFLFTVINEIKILQIDVPDYISACWVVSSCLEFVRVFEKKEITDQQAVACFAQIYDYSREKLLLIGESFNLLPSEEAAKSTNDIAAGLCKTYQVKDDSCSGSKSLLNAISSKKAFEQLYLQLCEKTRLLYTKVGRHRFAMKVGIDLAKFHLRQKDYSLAEVFLERALHTFRQTRWEVLHIDVLEPLADCLCHLKMSERYLWSLACLSCTKTLPVEKRLHYGKEFLRITKEKDDKVHTINTEPLISIEDVKISLVKEIGHIGEIISVILCLQSNLPLEFNCDGMDIRVRYMETDHQNRSFEVDGGSVDTKLTQQTTQWSEILPKPVAQSPDESERGKVSLLQRIRSRRGGAKQNDATNVNDNDNNEKSPSADNMPTAKRGQSSKGRRLDMNTSAGPNMEKTTLAEMAKTITLKDKAEERLKSSELTRNASSSSSSSLSNVSIVSDLSESNQDSKLEDKKLERESNDYDVGNVSHLNNTMQTVDVQRDLDEESKTDKSLVNEGQDNMETVPILDQESNNMDRKDPVSNTVEPIAVEPNAANTKAADTNAVEPNVAESNLADATRSSSNGCDTVDGDVKVNVKERIRMLNEAENIAPIKCEKQERKVNFDQVEDDIFDIEEEEEILPTKKLESSSIIIQPGFNSVSLSAKVLHEGRYALQSLSCRIGNVILYHLLDLPRTSRAFFVVSDPPKFTWTPTHLAECLLLGSKQRIHVTLSNGPGHIPASSVIRMSTTSGLEFFPVSPSSVFVYSLNKKDEPKEGALQIELESSSSQSALMYLPECGSYEMVDLFFDVCAPVSDSHLSDHMRKHEILFDCLWLNEIVNAKTKLESIFYEPFTIDYEYHTSQGGEFLHTILRNLNPVQIVVKNPILECLNSNRISFKLLSCDIPLNINAEEELYLIWLIQNNEEDSEKQKALDCQLLTQFKTEKQEEFGSFNKGTNISLKKPCLILDMVLMKEENERFRKGTNYEVRIEIRKTELPICNQYIFCVIDDNDQWKYNDDVRCRRCETQLSNGKMEIISNVTPCMSGRLEYPKISLYKSEGNENGAKREVKERRSSSSLAIEKLLSSRRKSASASDDVAKLFKNKELMFNYAAEFIEVSEPNKVATTV